MVSQLDKIKRQNHWLRELCDVEEQAIRMCGEIDLATCDPEVLVADKGPTRLIFDYWRVVLSSETQSPHFSGAGRSIALIVRDRNTRRFLGVVGLSDPPTHWTQLMTHLGWLENDGLRLQHQHRVFMMRRCLPAFEFGRMTGGKLLALAASSRDVIRILELRYSYQFLFFGIRTLHGKGSQYNRLNQRGIELIDVDDTDHGFYGMELRKKAVSFLRGETDAFGKTTTFTFADQVNYWRERWLKARMSSLSVGSTITLDPESYRLSAMLDAKRMTLDKLLTTEGQNGSEAEQEDEDV
ncbi:MAG: DUF4338 domain-containing protein [Burkholderiaceae bacterium]|nr:DUF4338 domain-containing protein [Burkholderiaceae bacterium]